MIEISLKFLFQICYYDLFSSKDSKGIYKSFRSKNIWRNYINASSQALVITAINLSGSNVLVTFTSQTGKVYRLEYINTLGSFNWQTAVDLIIGTGGQLQVNHAGGAVTSSQFYRVHQLP